ncbi:hypothetical protein K070079E91_15430 [Eisenbergiella porci]|jgi:hypothetical protein
MSRKQVGKLPKRANNYKEKEKEDAIIRANNVVILSKEDFFYGCLGGNFTESAERQSEDSKGTGTAGD